MIWPYRSRQSSASLSFFFFVCGCHPKKFYGTLLLQDRWDKQMELVSVLPFTQWGPRQMAAGIQGPRLWALMGGHTASHFQVHPCNLSALHFLRGFLFETSALWVWCPALHLKLGPACPICTIYNCSRCIPPDSSLTRRRAQCQLSGWCFPLALPSLKVSLSSHFRSSISDLVVRVSKGSLRGRHRKWQPAVITYVV